MTSTRNVDVATLHVGSEIGAGGQGKVYELKGRPDEVYKRYLNPAAVNAAAMQDLIDAPVPGTPEWDLILRSAAWITAGVEENGSLVGVLMRRVPTRFMGTLGGGTKLREIMYLIYPTKLAWESLGKLSDGDRLLIARDIARLFDALHAVNIVVGDVSGKNLVWAPSPDPGVMLLDCDALRRVGSHAPTDQLHTPDWQDPHTASGAATKDSDRYKLALMIGRLLSQQPYLTPGQQMTPLPGVAEPVRTQIQRVFEQAGSPAGQRPNAQQWIAALSERPTIAMPLPGAKRTGTGEGLTALPSDPPTRPTIQLT